jgi:hypothetical protein
MNAPGQNPVVPDKESPPSRALPAGSPPARTTAADQTFRIFHRKDAKNAKKSRKIDGENLHLAEPALVATIGYPRIERNKQLFLVARRSFASFASLR